MTLAALIPARSRRVLELTGAAAEGVPASRDAFLAIQPDCEYRVAADLTGVVGEFDAILAHGSLLAGLDREPLVALLRAIGDHLAPGGVLLVALDNIGSENNAATPGAEPAQAAAEAGLSPLRLSPRSGVHVLTAMRGEPPPRMLIHTSMGEAKVCAPVRVHMPNAFLAAEPNVFAEARPSGQPWTPHEDRRFPQRVFINQRVIAPSFADGVRFFQTMRQSGWLFLHEMDDFPYFRWKRYEQTGWINFISAHAIQTSTPYLADFFRQINPNVAVFANQLGNLPPPRDFAAETRDPERPVTIFFGALNREDDFMEILPALNAVARRHGDRLAFQIIAPRPIFDAIESDRKTHVSADAGFGGQLVPYAVYQAAMRASDIALLPLRDSLLGRAKSDLKFLECAANGAAALASPLAYSAVIRDGETGFLYRDEREFSDRLNLLIENAEKRRDIAAAAYRYVRHNRLMSQHYGERLAWYRECLAKLPELNAAAQARIDTAGNFRPKCDQQEP